MILLRYLTKEVYATALATTFLLLVIFICNQFVHYLGRAAGGSIPIKAVMQLMSLEVPFLLGFLLPLALFVSIFLVYGRLYVDNEMTVLAACGFSKGQLLSITLAFSTIVAGIVAIVMLWIEPQLAWYRDHIFAEAAAASPIETLFAGQFQTLDHGQLAVYVGDISRDRKLLKDVFVAKMPDNLGQANAPWMIISAAGGHEWIYPSTGDRYMVLTDGYRYIGTPGQKDFQIASYQNYGIRIESSKAQMDKEAEFMSTADLWKVRKQDRAAAAELQWRLTMPVSTLLLALIALPLSRVRQRTGRFARIAPGIILYVIYADLIFVAQAAVQKGTISPFPGIWWVHGGFLVLAVMLLIYYFQKI